MAAHRYWRLLVSATQGGGDDSTVIGELILATSPNGPSVATGGAASASSIYSSAYPASNAFDGVQSSSNAWCSAGGKGQWIQYDFGSTPRDIVEMRIYFPAAGTFGIASAPKNFALYWSDDGNTWTRQRAWSEQTFSSGDTITYDTTEVPPSLIANRCLPGVATYRNIEAVLPQLVFGTLTRESSGIARAHNWTRPWSVTQYSGKLRIAGTTTLLGMPKACRVDLLEQQSGIVVARTHTGPDGVFSFEQLADGVYTIIGVDNSGAHNSVIFAHVTPVP
jgi:hypothetical protein